MGCFCGKAVLDATGANLLPLADYLPKQKTKPKKLIANNT
jgi:hypothetical protein